LCQETLDPAKKEFGFGGGARLPIRGRCFGRSHVEKRQAVQRLLLPGLGWTGRLFAPLLAALPRDLAE